MKTHKSFSNMLTFATSTMLFVSCGLFSNENVIPDDISTKPFVKSEIQKLYENSFNGKTIVMNGDTVIENKPIKLHEAPKDTDIKNLLNKDGNFRMVSIGGGLTAGARDGGLYRNGQLTSFANLIAIQMKSEFKQPLFDEKDFNGFGYKVLNSMSNGVPKYKVVSNNLAILKSEPIIELNPFKGEIDNWSLPFTGFYDWGFDRNIVINASNPYKSRILPLNSSEYGKNNQLYLITNQNFDFFIMESGFDTYLNAILAGSTFTSSTANNLTPPNYTQFLKYALTINAKGVIATIPDITDFPISKLILAEDIRKKNQIEIYVRSSSNPNSSVIPIESGSFFLPTPLADSLMNIKIPVSKKRGFSFDNPLLNNEVYTLAKVKSLQYILNQENSYLKTGLNKYPIVDLYSLYKKIASGEYVTYDGLRVDKNNFFSSDGFFPSAFGQAVIANEYITTINVFYKTNIPLIITGYYLNK